MYLPVCVVTGNHRMLHILNLPIPNSLCFSILDQKGWLPVTISSIIERVVGVIAEGIFYESYNRL